MEPELARLESALQSLLGVYHGFLGPSGCQVDPIRFSHDLEIALEEVAAARGAIRAAWLAAGPQDAYAHLEPIVGKEPNTGMGL